MHKRKIIVANWKMNPATFREARVILRGYQTKKSTFRRLDVVVCPPLVFAPLLRKDICMVPASLGAQNVGVYSGGTHTGEISARMLKSVGVSHVIIGHSERRAMHETDDIINQKIIQALSAGLIPIVAIGESEKSEDAHRVLHAQLTSALRGIPASKVKKIIFAYEPRWAISRGPHDTRGSSDAPEHAIEKMLYMRRVLAHASSSLSARKNNILYGGSVRAKNVASFVKKGYGFDGVLVGGASLLPRELSALAESVHRA